MTTTEPTPVAPDDRARLLQVIDQANALLDQARAMLADMDAEPAADAS